jgi:NAD-dependent deacetylase
MTDTLIKQAAEKLHNAKQIAVLTGAGVSKESGVPTFRDALDGLWAKYDPTELATPQAFQKNPTLVWNWYTFRRGLVKGAKPNPGHIALAQIEQRYPKTKIITQNVDDLHEQAGSKHVIHLHGNIAGNKCASDCKGVPTYIDISALDWDEDAPPPRCPHCQAYVRPDVVWFGEMLPRHALEDASRLSQLCDVMLVVGTSGLVTPAASLPGVARDTGATIIEVNPDHSAITRIAHIKLDGPSGETLPQVVEALP